ncbi:MAG: hypothetical protein HN742_28380 [Lentisphaerae bacterium]|jgi:hypothetical protein|nr:hypothetical protein [Lentisphaerota bacterium]MBT4822532.1 hypothetical protein [Lentisphaerota bacterium]MBT5612586.1 hypothetical protein [Lentisphaerota bacterium]MBT7055688.1 hypothetical protein [Lentisphaerota bacterium]MBT7845824.1 hypothetical protein [Lentisphaerota bacterium]
MKEETAAIWQDLQEKGRACYARLREWTVSNPRRATQRAAFLVVALTFGLIIAWYPFTGWKTYDMMPVGLTVDLPSKPVAAGAGGRVPTPVAVFESRTEDVAVVVAAFETVTGEANPAHHVLKRAMDYLAHRPDMADVEYQITTRPFKRRPACHVSGKFTRDGADCRVVGTFVVLEGRVAQILCLFNDLEGARTMERIMKSVDIL